MNRNAILAIAAVVTVSAMTLQSIAFAGQSSPPVRGFNPISKSRQTANKASRQVIGNENVINSFDSKNVQPDSMKTATRQSPFTAEGQAPGTGMPAQVQTPPPGMNQQPPIQKPAPAPEPPLPKWRLVGVISGYGRASRAVFDFGLSTPKILTKGERLDRATTVAAVEPNGVKLTRGTETIEVQPW